MVDYSFIRLKTSKELAFNLQESPIVEYAYGGQIQLNPNDPKPYYQATNIKGGVTLGSNLRVSLVDSRCNEEDITAHFDYRDGIDLNSSNQIIFRIADLPTDYYTDLVYLKIVSDNTQTYYSNKFLVTATDIELTSRLDYQDTRGINFDDFDSLQANPPQELLSIQLQFFYDRHIDQEVGENYFQITKGQNVNSRFDFADLQQWRFIGVDSWTWKRLKRSFYSGRCYINSIRNYPEQAFDFTGRIEESNISEQTFVTDPYDHDTFCPKLVYINTPQPISIMWDSTLVTWDSTITTLDSV